jgi:PAS domain S-box-containing protein
MWIHLRSYLSHFLESCRSGTKNNRSEDVRTMPINTHEMSQLPNPVHGQELAGSTIGGTKSGRQVERSELQWSILEATLSSIAGFAYAFDRAGRFLYVNQPLLDLWGHTLQEAVGKNFFDLKYPEEVAARLQGLIQEAFATRRKVIDEASYASPNRAEGHFGHIFFPVIGLSGTDDFVVGTTRDITVRKHSERHPTQMEARYRGLLEAAPDAMVVVDEDGGIVLLNVRAEKQFGYSRDELVGKKVKSIIPEGFAEWLIADETRTAAEALAQQIGTGIELLGLRKDGSEFPIEIMLSPLESTEGILITAAIRDISERKHLARQLHQSQKMEAVGQLTGGITHDFNNLLTVIIGNLGLLDRLVSDNEAAVKRVRTAQKAAARGADITRRLLALSSNEELNPAFVSLGDAIQNMVEMASRGLGSDIKITTRLDHAVHPLFVDPAGLESALLNLVVNAKDAMPNGGSIVISSQLHTLQNNHPAVQAGDLKVGRYVCVNVTDTGQGMSQETLERACEPFFTTKSHDKGTGLGLAMVYEFAKQSGGIVHIYSELGHGTTVSFYLPIVADLSHPVQTDVPKDFSPRLGGTVLVVDDELDLLEVAVAYLEDMGFTAMQANDGASALNTIAEHREIDLMLTDIVMSRGMDGAEIAKRARIMRPGLKIIFSSGFPAEALAERAMPLVEGPLLRKPYQRGEFATIIRRVMDDNDTIRQELEDLRSGLQCSSDEPDWRQVN